jgi:hypothetical protein
MFAGTAVDSGNVVEHVQAQEASPDRDPPEPGVKALDVNSTGLLYPTYFAFDYFRLKPQDQAHVSVSARLGNSSHELATAAVPHRIFAGVTLAVVTTSSSVSPWIVQRQLKWPGNAVINGFTYSSARQG